MSDDSLKNTHSSGFMSGIVLGAVVGAALVLSLTEDKGDSFKDALRKKGQEVLKKLPDLLNEVEKRTEKVKDGVLEKSEHLNSSQVKTEVEDKTASNPKSPSRRFFVRSGKKAS